MRNNSYICNNVCTRYKKKLYRAVNESTRTTGFDGFFIMREKKCKMCNVEKPVSEFHKSKKPKDGLKLECKQCHSIRAKLYSRTKKGLITNIYNHQKLKSKKRGYNLPTYSKQELKDWLFSQNNFHVLFDNWKISGFKKHLIPSVDRINDYQSYTMENIQVMTWEQNNAKGYADIKNGINNKKSKAVTGINIYTGVAVVFYSMREAARQTGINRRSIFRCCQGKQNTAGGYEWDYYLLELLMQSIISK